MVDHSRGKHRNELDSWQSLRLFLFYRIGLWAVLLLMFLLELSINFKDEGFPTLFMATAISVLIANFILLPVTLYKIIRFKPLVIINGVLDLVGLTILLFSSSNGLSSGLALLMIPTIAAVGSLLPGRIAVAFAALSTIALLGLLVFSRYYYISKDPNYTLAGFQGIVYFIVASVAVKLARRAEESTIALTARDQDLSNLVEMNEEIIDRLGSGVIVVGDDGRIRMINQSAWKILGNPGVKHPLRLIELSSEIYTNFSLWKKRKDNKNYHQTAADANTPPFECRFVAVGDGNKSATLVFLEDIAEKNRQVQEEKLASLGRLTASIAHEIRNPLAAVSHSAQLLEESADLANKDDSRLINIIQTQSQRINQIIENVLGLSRRSSPVTESINLSQWLTTAIEEYRHADLKPENQITLDFQKSDQLVCFDGNQLRQVLWNLLANAQDHASKQTATENGITITLKGNVIADTEFTHIDVIDDGKGIEENAQRQLFEPFYTTHRAGTGLGLYVSRELCISNGGTLDYVPLPGKGSCFRIKLPVS